MRLLKIKTRRNITDAAFKEIVAAASDTFISLYKLTKTIKSIVSLKPIWVDMCINSCCAFTGDLEILNKCSYCKAERYQEGGRPRAQMAYFSIKDRFIIQYQDSTRAKQLHYCSAIGDVFDSIQYKHLSQNMILE